jgi:hypothetical protein
VESTEASGSTNHAIDSESHSHSIGEYTPHAGEQYERYGLDGETSEKDLVSGIGNLDVLDNDQSSAGSLEKKGEDWRMSGVLIHPARISLPSDKMNVQETHLALRGLRYLFPSR